MGSEVTSRALPDHLVLYDGDCGLCQRSVRWLLARDRAARLTFAPLGGETARSAGVDPGEADLSTLRYVTGGLTYTRSRAFFALLRIVDSRWSWLTVFRFLPAWLTDLPYRLIARWRYRIFGRADACTLPSPSEAARFLP